MSSKPNITKDEKRKKEEIKLKEIMDSEIDPSSDKSISDLFNAAYLSYFSIVKYLLESGVDIEARNDDGETFLMAACSNKKSGNLEIIKYLVEEKNADITAKDSTGWDSLHHACRGHLENVKYLIEERNADLTFKDGDIMNCLMVACSNGHLEIVKYLIEERNADISVTDDEGAMCLIYACCNGHLEIVKYLVEERNADISVKDAEGWNSLHHACRGGFLETVKYLIEGKNADITEKDDDGSNPLHHACQGGLLEIVKYLIEERNADISVIDDEGATCLTDACCSGQLEVVKYLIEERNADISEKDDDGWNLLHHTCRAGHLEIVKYLVEERNADILEKDANGCNSLHHACHENNLEVATYLIEERNADPSVQDNDRNTCLKIACRQGNLDMVKYLVEKGNIMLAKRFYAGVGFMMDMVSQRFETHYHTQQEGDTSVICACEAGHLEIVRYLVEEKNADLTVTDRYGRNSLHTACVYGQLEIIKYLVEEENCSLETKDYDGATALMVACCHGNLDIVKYLIEEKRADILEADGGAACMSHACRNGHLSVLKYCVIENWMKPPLPDQYEGQVADFLEQCKNGEHLSKQRNEQLWKTREFIHQCGLHDEWNSRHASSPFRQHIPLHSTHAYRLIERKPNNVADLKVYLPTLEKSSQAEEASPVVVYALKEKLGKSCAFMHNILEGDMNDVQPADEEGMESITLCQELLQDCPIHWLKQLIIFLSWSEKGDLLRHVLSTSMTNPCSFDEIVEALKFCRTCNTLSIEVDVDDWLTAVKSFIEAHTQKWIDSIINPDEVEYPITDISRFDSEMMQLWIQVWGETHPLHLFILANAESLTTNPSSTVAADCIEWIQSNASKAEGWGYRDFVEKPHAMSRIKQETGYQVIPTLKEEEGENEEDEESSPENGAEEQQEEKSEFVKRKRRRIESEEESCDTKTE